MKVYAVFRRSAARPEDAVLVKEGFSWPGFLFTGIWLILKRLWLALALYLLALAAISAAANASGLEGTGFMTMVFGLQLLMGFEANGLYRRALTRRGLVEDGSVVGADIEEAALKYFYSRGPGSSAPSASRPEAPNPAFSGSS